MIQTVEAMIDEHGRIRPLRATKFPRGKRALVTILDEDPIEIVSETALLSETSLAEDWNRPEEDEAWSYLQSEQ